MSVDELRVGKPVQRDDGRYYVPVIRSYDFDTPEGCSEIVLRIASDAFEHLGDAIEFAEQVVVRWNYHLPSNRDPERD